ncbi:DUF6869 domain-containing protein [Halothiobacillus diazotrophicus]|uniref:DUF6869 domain-containing protein n=1 Tax=Halothiobacillus diazotrophicus TaxID=1860122 RepID=UPI0018D3378C
MLDIDKTKLVTAWISLHHAQEKSPEYIDNFWAFTALSDLCDTNPDLCWDLIEEIRRTDGSEIILANLAAGPLEDLLSQHGPRFIETIEKQAKNDLQFKKMLGAMWQNNIADEVWKRVMSIADSSF